MAKSVHAAGTLPEAIEAAHKAAKDVLDREKDRKDRQKRVQVWAGGKKALQIALWNSALPAKNLEGWKKWVGTDLGNKDIREKLSSASIKPIVEFFYSLLSYLHVEIIEASLKKIPEDQGASESRVVDSAPSQSTVDARKTVEEALGMVVLALENIKQLGSEDSDVAATQLRAQKWLKLLVALTEACRGGSLGEGEAIRVISDTLRDTAWVAEGGVARGILKKPNTLGYAKLGRLIHDSKSAGATLNLIRLLHAITCDSTATSPLSEKEKATQDKTRSQGLNAAMGAAGSDWSKEVATRLGVAVGQLQPGFTSQPSQYKKIVNIAASTGEGERPLGFAISNMFKDGESMIESRHAQERAAKGQIILYCDNWELLLKNFDDDGVEEESILPLHRIKGFRAKGKSGNRYCFSLAPKDDADEEEEPRSFDVQVVDEDAESFGSFMREHLPSDQVLDDDGPSRLRPMKESETFTPPGKADKTVPAKETSYMLSDSDKAALEMMLAEEDDPDAEIAELEVPNDAVEELPKETSKPTKPAAGSKAADTKRNTRASRAAAPSSSDPADAPAPANPRASRIRKAKEPEVLVAASSEAEPTGRSKRGAAKKASEATKKITENAELETMEGLREDAKATERRTSGGNEDKNKKNNAKTSPAEGDSGIKSSVRERQEVSEVENEVLPERGGKRANNENEEETSDQEELRSSPGKPAAKAKQTPKRLQTIADLKMPESNATTRSTKTYKKSPVKPTPRKDPWSSEEEEEREESVAKKTDKVPAIKAAKKRRAEAAEEEQGDEEAEVAPAKKKARESFKAPAPKITPKPPPKPKVPSPARPSKATGKHPFKQPSSPVPTQDQDDSTPEAGACQTSKKPAPRASQRLPPPTHSIAAAIQEGKAARPSQGDTEELQPGMAKKWKRYSGEQPTPVPLSQGEDGGKVASPLVPLRPKLNREPSPYLIDPVESEEQVPAVPPERSPAPKKSAVDEEEVADEAQEDEEEEAPGANESFILKRGVLDEEYDEGDGMEYEIPALVISEMDEPAEPIPQAVTKKGSPAPAPIARSPPAPVAAPPGPAGAPRRSSLKYPPGPSSASKANNGTVMAAPRVMEQRQVEVAPKRKRSIGFVEPVEEGRHSKKAKKSREDDGLRNLKKGVEAAASDILDFMLARSMSKGERLSAYNVKAEDYLAKKSHGIAQDLHQSSVDLIQPLNNTIDTLITPRQAFNTSLQTLRKADREAGKAWTKTLDGYSNAPALPAALFA